MTHKFSLEELRAMDEAQEGACLKCGAVHDSLEPDARKVQCTECGARSVFGAEELMIMGAVDNLD